MYATRPSESANRTLASARAAKQDEFYTQYGDIQKEVEAYLEFDANTFRGKIVYCNCDDPFESNFFKYFAANFNKLGLKKLVTTSYEPSPIVGGQLPLIVMEGLKPYNNKKKAYVAEINEVSDINKDGAIDIEDVRHILEHDKNSSRPLNGDDTYGPGDFRSKECVELLKQADIVVTNPPFSLFREYVTQLVQHGKKFIIVGSKNAITYKEIFPLIQENKLWMGAGFSNGNAFFSIPAHAKREFADGVYDPSTGLVKFRNVGWFTNLDHGRRHQRLELQTMADNLRYSKHKELKGKTAYDRYDNYDAIEVPFTDAIPSDYDGVMGVPITFLDKYNPEQFEIVGGSTDGYSAAALGVTRLGAEYVGNVGRTKLGNATTKRAVYKRILIRHRKPETRKK
jgi:hypothetical protein